MKFQGSPYNQETPIKCITTKQPNLKFKTQTKELLGIFLLAFTLPSISFKYFIIRKIVFNHNLKMK
jgi:hypothetical protein